MVKLKSRISKKTPADDTLGTLRKIKAGLSYSALETFQSESGFSWEDVSEIVQIAPRTIHRRQVQGRLRPDESDRLLRAVNIFQLVVDLFEGDVTQARQWLLRPQPGLGGEKPVDFISTDIGTREVEKLVMRLQHGVFS